MARIFAGKYTAAAGQPFVVFIIGMRINRLLAVHKWLPTVAAMFPMLQTLRRSADRGCLHTEYILFWRGMGVLQYWRSFDDLERFAADSRDPHQPAWADYNRRVGADGTVGVFHESYLVQPGSYETLYGNMPLFGLAAATRHIPAAGRRARARGRWETGGVKEDA